MCGILGKIVFNNSALVLPDLNLLMHRGPDSWSESINPQGNVYFGHTRLSILELSPLGNQPMSDSSGRFTIIFNGEIYNHMELRGMMPHIKWNGHSDTETLVELYAQKGVDSLLFLRGMFAFAILDELDNSVLLVRDRLGIKPLWIKEEGESFTFSSEVRPLINKTDKCLPNKSALSEYITFGRLPSTSEIFQGIKSVKPGSWIKVFEDGQVERKKWWNCECPSLPRLSGKDDYVKRTKELIISAIEEHLISDVGVGAFLSGGIDSSIITLVAGKSLGKKLQTFTVGFPKAKNVNDERSIAKKVADKCGSEHFEIEVSDEKCLDLVKRAVNLLDLPSVDAINTFIVSSAVRETGLKVALSGLGGDELFGGYPSFKSTPLLSWIGNLPNLPFSKLTKILPLSFNEKFGGLTEFSPLELTVARRRFASVDILKSIGLGYSNPEVPTPLKGLDTMGIISWAEIYGYMIPMLLRDSDQMSMAVGLELRVPFLDHRLVKEVLFFPQKFKKGKGIKPLLLEAFYNDLPIELHTLPKQGFEMPMDNWIRGPLKEFTNEGLQKAADYLGIHELLNQMDNFDKRQIHWTRIWNWSVLGHWISNNSSDVSSLFKSSP